MAHALLLEVSRLQVRLDGKTILQDLGFELREKETLVILGPNGAGKTVLLRALLGLVPSSGTVRWRPGVKLGYVPQRVPQNKDLPMTVSDFFAIKGASPELALEMIREVGLDEPALLERQLGVLSSGQFQRVLIAWALVNRPEVLLLDEPTAGIDIGGEDTIHAFLHRTQEERDFAVILVTHDLTMVYSEATRALCINQTRFCYGNLQQVLDPNTLEEIYGRRIKFFGHEHGRPLGR